MPDDSVTSITTERLRLRPMTMDDVGLLVELDSDPEVMRFITGGPPRSFAETERLLRISLGYRWAAYEQGRFIGWFCIRPTDERPDDLELGYRLRRDAWGRGLGTEGSLAMVHHAFMHHCVPCVWAQTMTVNKRSRRVMEQCGLHYVRTFHGEWDEQIPGGEHGDVVYEISREEWDSRSE